MQIKRATESGIQTSVSVEAESSELKSTAQSPAKAATAKDVFENSASDTKATSAALQSAKAAKDSGIDVSKAPTSMNPVDLALKNSKNPVIVGGVATMNPDLSILPSVAAVSGFPDNPFVNVVSAGSIIGGAYAANGGDTFMDGQIMGASIGAALVTLVCGGAVLVGQSVPESEESSESKIKNSTNVTEEKGTKTPSRLRNVK